MKKGNMCLKILENGKFKNIIIKEGEIFLLPGKIPHSPQRESGTLGFVIERDRMPYERDALWYFVGHTTKLLYEKWFYCENLGTQLVSIIKEFFDSQQFKTGNPVEQELKIRPWIPDTMRRVENPFNLNDWIAANRGTIRKNNSLPLFHPNLYESSVQILGYGEAKRTLRTLGSEVLLWGLEDTSRVNFHDQEFTINKDAFLLIPGDDNVFTFIPEENSVALSIIMNPINNNKKMF